MRMESDEFDFLAPAYVRSFLKTYARFLHLEPGPLVEEFDRRYGAAKFETAQIAAMERRAKLAPKQRRLNSWASAAVLATLVLVVLAAIGLATGDPDDEPTRDRQVASNDETSSPEATASDEASPTPTPEPEESIVAFTEGIELEVIAARADSWLEVYADGEQLFYRTLATGETESFTAEEKMYIRLGYPAGVELIVNGENLGSPGGETPIDLILPDDVESAF
jgi:cytoskeleton protein RodZ